jgi:hypothetical protein
MRGETGVKEIWAYGCPWRGSFVIKIELLMANNKYYGRDFIKNNTLC